MKIILNINFKVNISCRDMVNFSEYPACGYDLQKYWRNLTYEHGCKNRKHYQALKAHSFFFSFKMPLKNKSHDRRIRFHNSE